MLMLSLAGIPPTAGFLAKWEVFAAVLRSGQWPLLVVGIAASVIVVLAYVRVVRTMFFDHPDEQTAEPSLGFPTAGVVALCVAATVVVGVWPGPLLTALGRAGGLLG